MHALDVTGEPTPCPVLPALPVAASSCALAGELLLTASSPAARTTPRSQLRCLVPGCTAPLRLRIRPRPHFAHLTPCAAPASLRAREAAALLAHHLAITHEVALLPAELALADGGCISGLVLKAPPPRASVLCWAPESPDPELLARARAAAAAEDLHLAVVRPAPVPLPPRLPAAAFDLALLEADLGCWWLTPSPAPTLLHPTLTLSERDRIAAGRAASLELVAEPLSGARLQAGRLTTPRRLTLDRDCDRACAQRAQRRVREHARIADPRHQARLETWRAELAELELRLEQAGRTPPACLSRFLPGQDELGVLPSWWKLSVFDQLVVGHVGERQPLTRWFQHVAAPVPDDAPVSLDVIRRAACSLLALLRAEGYLTYVGSRIPQSDVWILADSEPSQLLRDAACARAGLRVALDPLGRPCVLDELNRVRWPQPPG